MTEAEWQGCKLVWEMIELVGQAVSDRKITLFTVACCRRISHLLTDEKSRWALDVFDQYESPSATEGLWEKAIEAAVAVADAAGDDDKGKRYAALAVADAARYPVDSAGDAALAFAWTVAPAESDQTWSHSFDAEAAIRCSILRDIFGNPFRPVALDPAWRTTTVTSLAQPIYTDRAFDRLPILADALEDAGCADRAILDHCRQPGEHVRGCWIVDLVLGKE